MKTARETENPRFSDNPFARTGWIPLVIAALAGLALLWMARQYLAARAEADLRRDRNAFTEIALQSTRQQLEAERILNREQLAALRAQSKSSSASASLDDLQLAMLLSPTSAALGVLVWNPAAQQGALALEKFPPPPGGQRLELWLLPTEPGTEPISAGPIDLQAAGSTRTTFAPRQPAGNVAAFFVTRENDDGSRHHASPSRDVVLRGSAR